MAIIICLGNIGSGKTVTVVREMVMNKQKINYYTNINSKKPSKTKHIHKITADMIIERKQEGFKTKKDKSVEPIYKLQLNKDFWLEVDKPISVILDEAHTIMNPRRAMSKVNVIVGDFLALLRRVLGEDSQSEGDLYLITQLNRRLDVIGREMAHQIRYHVCHFTKTCLKCGVSWAENSEMPEQLRICPVCEHPRLNKSKFIIEVKHFAGIKAYEDWKDFGVMSYHRHYFINDIEDYFPYYNTHQWEDLFNDYYN